VFRVAWESSLATLLTQSMRRYESYQIQGIRIREYTKQCPTYAMYAMRSQGVTPAVEEVGTGLSVGVAILSPFVAEPTTSSEICVGSCALFEGVDSLGTSGSTTEVGSCGPV
jgi:hypothetical protein